ncbi:MAG TPA: NUDIX hydrolase [Chitinophagaceae bacterium]|nr:NUDIX hydrolase [Chitinophagaceae bacterium]
MNEQNPWQVTGRSEKYENNWIHVTEYQVINPSGKDGIYGKVHFKNLAIGILPLDDDWHTWLVGQYRFTIDRYTWEIPEGGGAMDVDPVDSARRELKEETGLEARHYTELLRLHLSDSITDEYSIIYLATGLTPGEAAPEETENITVRRLPFDAAYAMVQSGEITDVMSVAAIQKVKLMILEGQLPR